MTNLAGILSNDVCGKQQLLAEGENQSAPNEVRKHRPLAKNVKKQHPVKKQPPGMKQPSAKGGKKQPLADSQEQDSSVDRETQKQSQETEGIPSQL